MNEKANESFDIVRIIEIFWRRRWPIAIVTMLCAALAGLLAYIQTPVYQSTVDLRVPKVWGNAIIDPVSLVAIINGEGFLQELVNRKIFKESVEELAKSSAISAHVIAVRQGIQETRTDMVRLLVRRPTPEKAEEVAEKIIQVLKERFDPIYDRVKKELLSMRSGLAKKQEDVGLIISQLHHTIEQVSVSPEVSAPSAILLQAQLEDRERQLLEIQKELVDVIIKSENPLLTAPLRALFPPVKPSEPLSPKPALYVALGGSLGVILAFLVAFFLEHVDRVKTKQQEALAISQPLHAGN